MCGEGGRRLGVTVEGSGGESSQPNTFIHTPEVQTEWRSDGKGCTTLQTCAMNLVASSESVLE